MSKSERDVILRRRARFLSVALAGVGLAGSLESCKRQPQVCLSPTVTDPEPQPTPCLSVAQPEEDAGTETRSDAGAEDDAGAPPHPCLSPIVPEEPPRPCLSVLPPKEKKK